jgi:hypothetical protein
MTTCTVLSDGEKTELGDAYFCINGQTLDLARAAEWRDLFSRAGISIAHIAGRGSLSNSPRADLTIIVPSLGAIHGTFTVACRNNVVMLETVNGATFTPE